MNSFLRQVSNYESTVQVYFDSQFHYTLTAGGRKAIETCLRSNNKLQLLNLFFFSNR